MAAICFAATADAQRYDGQFTGRIQGLEFKQALFGIWLAEKPTQQSLKHKLLRIDRDLAE